MTQTTKTARALSEVLSPRRGLLFSGFPSVIDGSNAARGVFGGEVR